MGNRTLKAGLFAALAAGALWVLPMSAWAAPVFPEGISADGESLAGKNLGRCPAYSRRKSERSGGYIRCLNH